MVQAGGMWQERALISLREYGASGAILEFWGKTDDIKLSGGGRKISLKQLMNGGNLVKFDPQEIIEAVITAYPTEIDEGLALSMGNTNPASQPLSATNSLVRKNFRLAVMWTDDPTCASAEAATTNIDVSTAYKAMRLILTNCYSRNPLPTFDDKELKHSIEVEAAPFKASLTNGLPDGNLKVESTDGTHDALLLSIAATTTW